jgi:signal transduction histidine kinase
VGTDRLRGHAEGEERRGVRVDALAGHVGHVGHVGLAMVRRRVEDAGGRFYITTRRDGGTRTRIAVPNASRST